MNMAAAPAMSPIVMGCMRLLEWGLNAQALRDRIAQALDLGITTFDHADCYGGYRAEAAFGEALALDPALRDRMVLIGKVGVMFDAPDNPVRIKHYNLSAAHIVARVERSLRLLRTDRLDHLLLHRPDPLMRPDEIATAFETLRRDGKVLALGVSNFPPSTVRMLAARTGMVPSANQVRISLEHPDALFDGTLDACMEMGTVPMAWSPLGGGRLFGDDPEGAGLRRAVADVAGKYGAAPDQIALAWLMAHPAGIRPIVGTGRADRLAGAAGAARIALDRQDWYALLEAATGSPRP